MTPTPTSTLPTWTLVLWGLVTLFASAISGLIGHLLTRKKQQADIGKTHADIDRTHADTEKIVAETRQIDSEILFRAYDRLDELETITRNQNSELVRLDGQKVTLEWRLSLSEAREKVHLEQLRLANAELEMLRTKEPFNPADLTPKPLLES